ncbi:MAG: hypothetical protein ABIP75_00935 [Pyrinomonadaceae bacterium]
MDKLVAMDIREHSLRALVSLRLAVVASEASCTTEEYAEVEQGARRVANTIHERLLKHVYTAYPELDHWANDVQLIEVGEVMAERHLHLMDADGIRHEIKVLIGRPFPRPGGTDVVCPFRISGYDVDWRFYGFGPDSDAALQCALRLARSALKSTNPWQGRLRGNPDDGLNLLEPEADRHG